MAHAGNHVPLMSASHSIWRHLPHAALAALLPLWQPHNHAMPSARYAIYLSGQAGGAHDMADVARQWPVT